MQFGALSREFTGSASTKASSFVRAGVGGTWPVSHDGGSDRYLKTFRDVRVVPLVEGLRSLGVFTMTLRARLPMGLMEAVSAIGKYPEVWCGDMS